MGGAVHPLPHTPSWRSAQLGGAQGQLYLFTLPLTLMMSVWSPCVPVLLWISYISVGNFVIYSSCFSLFLMPFFGRRIFSFYLWIL
jgi:hypothetical protein